METSHSIPTKPIILYLWFWCYSVSQNHVQNIIVATCTRDNDSHTLKHINLIETQMPA